MSDLDIVRTVLRAILPAPIVGFFDRLAEATIAKLQGETLRAIGYGAALVLWAATRIADWLIPGRLPVVSIDVAMVFVTAAVALVVEFARRWVSSPATVARMEAEHAEELDAAKGNIVSWFPVENPSTTITLTSDLDELAAAESGS